MLTAAPIPIPVAKYVNAAFMLTSSPNFGIFTLAFFKLVRCDGNHRGT
jgi:hypothetical protein